MLLVEAQETSKWQIEAAPMQRGDALWWLGGQVDNYVDSRVPKVLVVTFPRGKEELAGYDILLEHFPRATLCDNEMRDRWALRGAAASEFAAEIAAHCYVARAEMTHAATVPALTMTTKYDPVIVTSVSTGESTPFPTLDEASVGLGAKLAQMQAALSGRQKTCAGHTVKFATEREDGAALLKKRKAADGELKELRDAAKADDIIPDDRPLAYYGGLFEHRGRILPNNGSLSLAMVHKDAGVCNALQRRFGGRVQLVPNKKRGQQKIRDHQWTLDDSAAAMDALQLMEPFLPSRRGHVEAARKDLATPPITEVPSERMLKELRNGVWGRPGTDWSKITEDQRWWIGGQHDGDGSSGFHNGSHRVAVGKARSGYVCLHHLQHLLGGSISKEQPQKGNCEASKQWYLFGRAALEFCQVMQYYTFLKKPQLELAAVFPYHNFWLARVVPVVGTNIETGERHVRVSAEHNYKACQQLARHTSSGHTWTVLPNEWVSTRSDAEIHAANAALEAELKALKHVEHGAIDVELPKPYMAGFVDADGCISLIAAGAQSHSISQKYIAICEAFQQQYGGGVTSDWERPVHQWYTHVAFAGRFLGDIAPYLVEKHEQARLILEMLPGEGKATRAAVQALHGRRLYYDSLKTENKD